MTYERKNARAGYVRFGRMAIPIASAKQRARVARCIRGNSSTSPYRQQARDWQRVAAAVRRAWGVDPDTLLVIHGRPRRYPDTRHLFADGWLDVYYSPSVGVLWWGPLSVEIATYEGWRVE